MASIVTALEPLQLSPVPGGARRQLLIFLGEALGLVATLVLGSADSGQPPINPMQSSELPDVKLAGHLRQVTRLGVFSSVCSSVLNECGPPDWSKLTSPSFGADVSGSKPGTLLPGPKITN